MGRSAKSIVILGASLAGITSAYILGLKGHRVTVVDPRAFPRRKACGEGLSLLGVKYLAALGLWTDEVRAQAFPFFGYDIHFEGHEQARLAGEEAHLPQGYGISRIFLDSAIHRHAAAIENITLLVDSASSVSSSRESWRVQTSSGEELCADELLVGCGGGRALERLFPQVVVHPQCPSRFGFAFWCTGRWETPPPSLVQLHHQRDGEYIITPLGENEVNVSILLSKHGSGDSGKQEIVENALRILADVGFVAEECSEPLGAPSIHSMRVSIRGSEPLPFLIGDSIERFDPIGGMGMTHALFSACIATREVLSGRSATSYLKKRRYGAAILRQITRMSYTLNVSRSQLLRTIARKHPSVAFRSNEILKKAFPSPTLPWEHKKILNVSEKRECGEGKKNPSQEGERRRVCLPIEKNNQSDRFQDSVFGGKRFHP